MLSEFSLDNNLGLNWFPSNVLMNNGDYGTPGVFNSNNSCNGDGDINGDLDINVVDVILLVNYILYNQSDIEEIECLADLDENNIINILDVVLLIEYILGIN